jgi:hypothetical protein
MSLSNGESVNAALRMFQKWRDISCFEPNMKRTEIHRMKQVRGGWPNLKG